MPDAKIDADVALEIAAHEGLVRQTYKDSVGVWTWSIGVTSASGHKVERYIGNPQTLEKCLEIWIWLLERYANDVRSAFGSTSLTKTQFAAALSFHWNTGAIKRATWVARFKAGDISGARLSFLSWNKPPEIRERRRREAALFFDGKWSNDGKVTEYARVRQSGTPDWSSARRVDIRREVEKILRDSSTPVPHPRPPSLPPTPGQAPSTEVSPFVALGILLAMGAIVAFVFLRKRIFG